MKSSKRKEYWKKPCDSVLDMIGATPLIRLHHVSEELGCKVFAKVEAFNPGHSAKDRVALYMIEQAEKDGRLRPGGTIVEASSGNTGFSIAMVAALKGYRSIVTVPSKISEEKANMLRAMGAELVICPKEAAPDDPASYYSRAESIAGEMENACYLNQNHHPDNVAAHYATTGPEIWKQTRGKIDWFLCPSGTGGTISGAGKYLKSRNRKVRVVGVDAYGSVIAKFHESGIFDEEEIYPNTLEGVGKSIIPGNTLFEVIDQYVKASDKASAHCARRLAREEGLLVGYSSGATLAGLYNVSDRLCPGDTVVLMFPDHGSRYISKIYNDQWMKQQGFLDEEDAVRNAHPGKSWSRQELLEWATPHP